MVSHDKARMGQEQNRRTGIQKPRKGEEFEVAELVSGLDRALGVTHQTVLGLFGQSIFADKAIEER